MSCSLIIAYGLIDNNNYFSRFKITKDAVFRILLSINMYTSSCRVVDCVQLAESPSLPILLLSAIFACRLAVPRIILSIIHKLIIIFLRLFLCQGILNLND